MSYSYLLLNVKLLKTVCWLPAIKILVKTETVDCFIITLV